MQTRTLTAPFPYFGGKKWVAPVVWERLGNVANYVEPFCGSCAVLLARPDVHEWWNRVETINDADGLVSNVWRALKLKPEEVAEYADWPVNECDLTARHQWLVDSRERVERLMAEPEWCDPKVAGWWIWGMSCWIGSEWCARKRCKILHHLGNKGTGVHKKRPHLTHGGMAIHSPSARGLIDEWFARLSTRLRHVRVCTGGWKRVVGYSPTLAMKGVTGVFLDPPYSHALRDKSLYAKEANIAEEVQAWCLEVGDEPRMRIALCGLEGEYELPGWSVQKWKAQGGYSNQSADGKPNNREKERIWFSPHCRKPSQGVLFND